MLARALQAASQNGHLEVIKVLLRYKADVEIEVSTERSAPPSSSFSIAGPNVQRFFIFLVLF